MTSVSIPSKVKTIEQYTFQECTNLESLTLPEELLSIGNSAFWGCNLLVSINIPKSVTSIGQYAFWGCSSLPKIDIPAIENIEKYTFAECHSLISISIPEVVKMIGQNAFQGCKSLASISIPNSVTSIGAKCFAGCSSLKKISLPYGITNISSGLFKDCSSLQDIDLPSTIDYIENEAFSGCSSLETFNIPQKVSGIYESTFRGCSNLKSVTIPENVTNIGQTAFYECSSLESIDIPANVSFIGRSVFGGCFSLGSIFIDKNNIVYDSRDNCNAIIETGTNTLLYGCNNTTIPNGIVAIENWAFNKSTGLSILNIPESVTSIQDYSFVECTGLKSITVDKANPKYDSRDNCNAIIETATNRLILACSELVIPKGITSFSNESLKNCVTLSLPEDMVTITSGMFYGCDKLESLKIPGSVTKIEESSLNNCSNLKNLSFEEGKETLTFEVSYPAYYSKPQWFSNCPLDSIFIARNLKYDFTPKGYGTYHLSPFREKKTIRKVVFGDNVSIIPNGIFSECTNLKAVKMPSKTETLGGSAFYKCDSLTYISIPEGIKEIGSSTFYGCGKIPSFVIPQGVETIGESAFFSCDSISSIIIPNSVTYIARNAFGGCKNLSELKIEDGSEDLAIREESYMLAFGQCPLESIYLGRNIRNDSYNYIFSSLASIQTPFDLKISSYVTKLSGGTFANCRQIKTLSFEEGKDTLTLIKDHNAYSSIMPFDKTPIDSIYMGRVVIGYDNYYPDTKVIPFSNTDSVYTMTIGANFTEIGDGLFYRWQVDKLIIPENVLSIGVDAFSECASLYSVKIEDGDKALEFKDGTGFAKCQLKELYLGRKIIYDTWKSPFRYNKEALSSVIIGNQVTEISMCEFVGLKSLKEIVLPQSLTKIDYQAFYGCESLADVTSYAKEVPVTGETVFTESYLPKATLHILESSRDAYKSNYPWSKFGCFALIKENGEEEYITIGDANGDRKVDAEDIVAITNFIMGNPSDGFNFDGADTNGDGIIDIADIVNISNISVGVK